MLDDAIQIFKDYFSTLIGKKIKYTFVGKSCDIYPKRIVYDTSRLVKSCSNPVINEAAQIALECDAVYNGVKSTGLLHLTSAATTSNAVNYGTLDDLTTEERIYCAMFSHVITLCDKRQLYESKHCNRFLVFLFVLGLYQIDLSNKPLPS